MERNTQSSFTKDGTKKEQIKWFAENDDQINGAHAIAFCVGASPDYARKVLRQNA